jgi:hypothetical protein
MGEVVFWSGSGRGRVQGKGEDRIGWLQAEELLRRMGGGVGKVSRGFEVGL